MNVERLKQTIDFILERETENQLQQKLSNVLQTANALVGQPQHPPSQTNFAAALEQFDKATNALFASLTPAQIDRLKEIAAYSYFSPPMVTEIQDLMLKTGLTPAVLQQHINKLVTSREAFLTVLRSTTDNLKQLGVGPAILKPGSTEFGFRLPELLFQNNFTELVKRLADLGKILRFFSEAVTGQAEPIEVHQISSTDPTFFLGLDVSTAVELGVTVTWLLNTLKQVLEIRNLRNSVKAIGFSDEELKVFDDRIQKKIDENIDERVRGILDAHKHETRRDNLEKGLKWAAETLVAWIERGLTIEVRTVRPPATKDAKADSANNEIFSTLETISQQLSFPSVEGSPVLQLPKDDLPTLKKPQMKEH